MLHYNPQHVLYLVIYISFNIYNRPDTGSS